MNEYLRWLKMAYEGALQTGAALDSLPDEVTPLADREMVEAVHQDADRLFRSLASLLRRHGAEPDWMKDIPLPPQDADIPF